MSEFINNFVSNITKNIKNVLSTSASATSLTASATSNNKVSYNVNKNIIYYNTYLIIAFIIAFYGVAFFYSFRENSELICLIIFLIFNIFLLIYVLHTIYNIVIKNILIKNKNNTDIFTTNISNYVGLIKGIFNSSNELYLKIVTILRLFLLSTLPISVILVIISNIVMIAVFDNLFGMYIVESNKNSIPLSERSRTEFQRYKIMFIVVFFLFIFLFCYLINDWFPTEKFGNSMTIIKLILVTMIGLALLIIPGFMLSISVMFNDLRGSKVLFNN